MLVTGALRTADDFRQVVVDYAAEAAAHGAVYFEGIFSPGSARGARPGRRLRRLLRRRPGGARAARSRGAADAGHPARLRPGDGGGGRALRGQVPGARRRRPRARRPGGGPPAGAVRAGVAIAREGGLASVPHAGEVVGPESVRGALDALKADRIRHGIRAVEDPGCVRELAGRGIGARRLPDLEPADARSGLARRAPAATARRRRCACARSRPTTRRSSAPISPATARRLSASGSIRRDFYAAGVEGALCDAETKNRPRGDRRELRVGRLPFSPKRRYPK